MIIVTLRTIINKAIVDQVLSKNLLLIDTGNLKSIEKKKIRPKLAMIDGVIVWYYSSSSLLHSTTL